MILGINTQNTSETIRAIENGLPTSAIFKLQAALGLTTKAMAATIHISQKTIERKRTEKLNDFQSERVLRTARIYDLAIEVFEEEPVALEWLKTPNPALEEKTPLEFLGTEPGAREVENLLMRIEYGVYS